MVEQKTNVDNEPISIGTKIFLACFAFAALVLLPLGVASWFSQSLLPFLPGSAETTAQVERKYTSIKSTRSDFTRTAYHLSYAYTVDDQRLQSMAVVDRELYDKTNEGQDISVRYSSFRPNWSCPTESPPSIKDKIFFAVAGIVILALWTIALLAIRYTIWPAQKKTKTR